MNIFKTATAISISFLLIFAFDYGRKSYFIDLIKTSSKISHSSNSEDLESFQFPSGFMFGVASSAFQIEGSWNEDGKSASMWDVFTHEHPERVVDRSTADIGPNSYRFFDSDIEAVKSTGFQHYRFSISWTRIMPNGSALNLLGVKYYEKIIDGLIARNIEPVITIFHWDLPQFLQDLGGLTNPIFVDYFTAYADALFKAFGNKVKRWITVNEPYTSCILSYEIGMYAPGIKSPGVGNYLCVHHLLMAHAAAYHLYDRKYRKQFKGEVGIALESIYFFKNGSTDEEQNRAMQYRFGWYANPIFGSGGYPQVMVDEIGEKSRLEGRPYSRLPEMTEKVKNSILGTSDFFGLNYYTSSYLKLVKPENFTQNRPSWFTDCNFKMSADPSWKKGKNAWMYSVPEGLTSLLNWIKVEYKNPKIFITENGWSDDGEIEDEDRIDYFESHLRAVARAIRDGCNVIGYTAWSLLDCYEWNTGYTVKYGIFNVNFSSSLKERSPKKSVGFWKKFLKERKIEKL